MKSPCVYILQCSDGHYYTGCTSNLERRLWEHQTGQYPGYTSKRLPVVLKFFQRFARMDEAIRAEKQIKGWSRAKKEALIAGDFDLLHRLAECRNESHYRPSTSLRATDRFRVGERPRGTNEAKGRS